MKTPYITMMLALYAANGYAQSPLRQKELDSIAKIRTVVTVHCTSVQKSAAYPELFFSVTVPFTWGIRPGDVATMKQHTGKSGPTCGWSITFRSGKTYLHGSIDAPAPYHPHLYQCTVEKTDTILP